MTPEGAVGFGVPATKITLPLRSRFHPVASIDAEGSGTCAVVDQLSDRKSAQVRSIDFAD